YRELCRAWGLDGRAAPPDAVRVSWWRAAIIAIPVAVGLAVPDVVGFCSLWGAWWAGYFWILLTVCLGVAGLLLWRLARPRPPPAGRGAPAGGRGGGGRAGRTRAGRAPPPTFLPPNPPRRRGHRTRPATTTITSRMSTAR